MTVSVGVLGLSGRMGRMIVREILDDPECALAGGTVREGGPNMNRSLNEIIGLASNTPLPAHYWRFARWWEGLGYPAFAAMLAVFYLMVAKPSLW